MALDPRIILAGQPADILGAMEQGNRLGAQSNALRQSNALESLYKSQGAGIAAGDPNALNALAGVDPMAAIGVQGELQSQRFGAEKQQFLRDDIKRQVEAQAASMTAAQRAEEAAKIEQAVKAGLAAQSPEQWDALVTQMGATDLVGQFANRDGIANTYMSVADILKRQGGPEWVQATPEQAAGYGASAGQINTKTGQFKPLNPPSGMSIETGPDGSTRIIQGPGAGGGKAFTESQSKDITYATRAEGALSTLEDHAGELTNRTNILLESVPLGVGREGQSSGFQVARTAGDEFLQAILRKDTGAAITTDEREEYGRVYLPQPGDSPEVSAYRKQARRRAVDALEAGMSASAALAKETALAKTAIPPAQTADKPSATPSGAPQVGVVEGGFRFLGGDPSSPSSWEVVQ